MQTILGTMIKNRGAIHSSCGYFPGFLFPGRKTLRVHAWISEETFSDTSVHKKVSHTGLYTAFRTVLVWKNINDNIFFLEI